MSISWDDLIKDAGDTQDFEVLPEGDYDLEVKEVKAKTTASGKKMYATTNVVTGGAYNKRQLWDNLVVSPESPAALGMFFRKMAALGLTQDYFRTNPSDDAICSALKGRRFRAQVGQRTWQGEKKNEIKKYHMSVGTPAIPGIGTPPPAAAAAAAPPIPAPAAAPPAPAPNPTFAPAAAVDPAPAPTQDPWAAAAQVTAATPPAPAPVFDAPATQPPANPAYAEPAAPAYAEQPAAVAAPPAAAPAAAPAPEPAPVQDAPGTLPPPPPPF